MEDRHIAEHFVVAGLPPENPEPLEEFNCDGAALKSNHSLPPITDIAVVNTTLGEVVPDGYTAITHTPSGGSANLNLGVFRAPEMFLCYKRGTHQLPLVDIGVLYDGRERVLADSQVVQFTITGNNSANINPSGHTTYMTYRRANPDMECNELVVSDICIKNREAAPHSYCTIEKNINKGSVVGSEVNVCYRKSVNRANYIAYKPALLDHCSPVSRTPSFSLPSDLALFCVPMGATLESWPPRTVVPGPVFSTFVLTVTSPQSDQVDKVYCAGVTFYERYDHKKLTKEQCSLLKLDNHFGVHNLVYSNKSICLMSLWPFFDTFETFLKYLHKMAYSGTPHTVPIERYIWYLLETVPFPSPRRPRILLQLDPVTRLSLTQPEDSPISLSGAKFRELLSILRPSGCIQVLVYALTEQKVLLHSLRPAVLTAAAEALAMIIFPFHWQCPYIPLCPLGLSSFLNAPIPFLLGLDSRFFDLYHPPTDVICVDLDTGAISIPEDKRSLNEKMLPRRALKSLRYTLENLCINIYNLERSREKLHKSNLAAASDESTVDTDFKIKKMEQEVEVDIQEAFLTFTAGLLHGYSSFLQPIVSKNTSPDTATLFDVEGFVKSRERAYQKFYYLLVNTQMFSKFIEERSFVSDKDISLAFFDECVERVASFNSTGNGGEHVGRLLEVETGSSEHTFFLPPPEPPPNAKPGETWTYQGFPMLDKSLYCPPVSSSSTAASAAAPRLSAPSSGVGHAGGGGGSAAQHPGSPMARRSKQEVRNAHRHAQKQAQTPLTWAKCLVSTSYSVWFTQLSSFALTQQHRGRVLQLAYKVLLHIQKLAQHNTDEVSYRIMMQLCGVYSQPVLAVQVLCAMTALGISPNAITYGYYNRAVLENKWTHSNLFWNKLRNVVSGVAAFKSSGRDRADRRRLVTPQATPQRRQRHNSRQPGRAAASVGTMADQPDSLSIDGDSCSRLSLESEASMEAALAAAGPAHNTDAAGSVVHSAGLVMTSPLDDAVFEPSQRHRSRPTDLAHALTPTLHNYDLMSDTSVPRSSEAAGQMPDYLRNASMGGDGRIMNRLWSFASSYIPSSDSNYNTPSNSVQNTPRRTPQRKDRADGPGERWERSVERWDNSPKVARDREKRGAAMAAAALRASSATREVRAHSHARTDSGSSAGSCGDPAQHCTTNVSGATAVPSSESFNERVKKDKPGTAQQTGTKVDNKSLRGPANVDDGNSIDADSSLKTTTSVRGNFKSEATTSTITSITTITTASITSAASTSTSTTTTAVTKRAVGEADSGSGGGCQSEDSLSDIAEEDQPNPGGALARGFFTRNAPERLSSLIKRGVGGADEKLRGIWRKGVSRSSSKDSMGSVSSAGSLVSSPSGEKLASPTSCEAAAEGGSDKNSDQTIRNKNVASSSGTTAVSPTTPNAHLSPSRQGPQETTTAAPSSSIRSTTPKPMKSSAFIESGARLTQSTTDQKLFLMKGEQPRLFQQDSPDEFETPPTSPVRSATDKCPPAQPVTVPVCPGRFKVILGDPLGALDSPTNSPAGSPPNAVSQSLSMRASTCTSSTLPAPDASHSNLVLESVKSSLSEFQEDDTVQNERISGSDSSQENVSLFKSSNHQSNNLDRHLKLKVSTVKRTLLTPLTSELSLEDTPLGGQSDSSVGLLKSAEDSSSVMGSNTEPVSEEPPSNTEAPSPAVQWSIAPIGSPFAVPIAISSSRASTLPRSATEEHSSPPRSLPPLAPKTPSRAATSSGNTRQSRSSSKTNIPRHSSTIRSSSANNNTTGSSSSGCGGASSGDSGLLLHGPDSRSNSSSIRGVQRTSNSLTSLSSALIDPSGGGGSEAGHRRRGSDLAPRHAATLESNYSPSAAWSHKWISEQGHQLNGAALSHLASSGLQKLGTFRENYLDPTVAELLGNSGSGASGRRSELLSGGISSMKSAVSSFSKKFRQSISTSNTPTRGAVYGWRSVDGGGGGTGGAEEDDSVDGLFSWSRRESNTQEPSPLTVGSLTGSDELLLPNTLAANLGAGYLAAASNMTLGGCYNEAASTGQLLDAFQPGSSWEAAGPYCLAVSITSCSKCHNCRTLLYDEEIMAGWRPDDSNLNTKCRYCERFTVPVLTVTLYDLLHLPRDEAPGGDNDRRRMAEGLEEGARPAPPSKEDVYKNIRSKVRGSEPLTVAYLSPLVLRKELETMLSQEGDLALTLDTCPDKHPILYWNMMWYFSRLGLPSQLAGLCLAARLAANADNVHPSWSRTNDRQQPPPPGPPAAQSADVQTAEEPGVSSSQSSTNSTAITITTSTGDTLAADGAPEGDRSSSTTATTATAATPTTATAAETITVKEAISNNGDDSVSQDIKCVVSGDRTATVVATSSAVCSDQQQQQQQQRESSVNEVVAAGGNSSSAAAAAAAEQVDEERGGATDGNTESRAATSATAAGDGARTATSTSDGASTTATPPAGGPSRRAPPAGSGQGRPDWRNVFIICMWDNPLHHKDVGPPLYVQLRERGQSSALVKAMVNQPLLINENVLQSLLTCLHFDDMHTAMKMFVQELRKRPYKLQQHRLPLYRDLLLLAADGLPHNALNMVSFEQKYRAAYDQLDAGLLQPADSAPPLAANFAKRCFPPLSL